MMMVVRMVGRGLFIQLHAGMTLEVGSSRDQCTGRALYLGSMRALLLLSLFCSGALLRAQGTVSSVTAGAWTSAGTWDCACVPQTGDTIVVQHSVGLPSNVVHLGGAIRITATGARVGSGLQLRNAGESEHGYDPGVQGADLELRR